jgi:hypothetical protein
MNLAHASWWPLIISGLLALICLVISLRLLRHKRLIDDLPTSRVQGVFIGQCELKGTAESEKPFTSYLAERRCVLFDWRIEEHWSRTVIVMTKNGPVPHNESGWKDVAHGGQRAPFYLKDDTGAIRIVPEGAELYPTVIFDETCARGNPLYFGKGPTGEIANSTHRRRFHEAGIPLHAQLYVTGQARECQDIVAPEIAHDKCAPLFIISTRSEKQISRGYLLGFWVWFIVGLLLMMAGAAIQMAQNTGLQPSPVLYWLAGGVYFLVFLVGWLWLVFNSLIGLRNRVRQAWSQVDIQLKRRYDLIPRLVECVAGYRNYEADTQEAVTTLRSQMESSRALQSAAPTLFAIAERYPELKASESFLKLQKELSDTEQRLALARGYYNDIVTFYNTRLDIFPDRLAAALAGLRHQLLLEASNLERKPIIVSLED